MDEKDNGETWGVCQVQGANSRRSYRVATCLRWHSLLGGRTREYATHPEASVRRLTMPDLCEIDNIDGAASESVGSGYNIVKAMLGMRWSKDLQAYISHVRDGKIVTL